VLLLFFSPTTEGRAGLVEMQAIAGSTKRSPQSFGRLGAFCCLEGDALNLLLDNKGINEPFDHVLVFLIPGFHGLELPQQFSIREAGFGLLIGRTVDQVVQVSMETDRAVKEEVQFANLQNIRVTDGTAYAGGYSACKLNAGENKTLGPSRRCVCRRTTW
jgi:hypothetical protein